MRISLSVTNFSWPPSRGLRDEIVNTARMADVGGLDTLWVSDHLLQADPNSTPDAAMLEAYTTLGFLAAHTHRIRLGAMVTAVTFRPPALLIKAVTTLDVLTDGRAWLGLGAGYQQDEAQAMGLPLPPVSERFERLEETLQIATQMWAGDTRPFHGQHYTLEHPVCSPTPATRPRPPILIGGMGEHKTLRLVAQYADACNLFDIPDNGKTIRHKLDVLARHCQDAGCPFDAIEKTISTRLAPDETTAQLVKRCRALATLGIDHAIFVGNGPWTAAAVAVLVAAAHALKQS